MSPRFLSQPISKIRAMVNVGVDGDCGFRSVAAGLIDNFLTHSHLSLDLLSKVLTRHYSYFPQHRPVLNGLIQANDRMKAMLEAFSKPELIQTMAYTLRQFAVDEMNTNPEKYVTVFFHDSTEMSLESMRKPETWLDINSIKALANALNMPIEIRVVELGKELPLPPLNYPKAIKISATNPKVVIELEAHHYRPLLLEAGVFRSDIYQTLPMILPQAGECSTDRTLSEIRAMIEAEEQRVIDKFETVRDNLTNLVNAGELTKQNLLDIYTTDVEITDDNHDAHHFPMNLVKARGIYPVGHSVSHTYAEEVTNGLVNRIAREISVGHRSSDEVYALIDNPAARCPLKLG